MIIIIIAMKEIYNNIDKLKSSFITKRTTLFLRVRKN